MFCNTVTQPVFAKKCGASFGKTYFWQNICGLLILCLLEDIIFKRLMTSLSQGCFEQMYPGRFQTLRFDDK